MKYVCVSLNKRSIKKYLDGAIRVWRKRKMEAEDHEAKLIAKCYIDAFQSIRMSLFGELLKED